MIVLALESSTSSAKAILYDTACGVRAVKTIPYPQAVCAGGQFCAGNSDEVMPAGFTPHALGTSVVARNLFCSCPTPNFMLDSGRSLNLRSKLWRMFATLFSLS